MTIERIREICAELPDVDVAPTKGGHHDIQVRGRRLAWHLVNHHGDGRVSLTVRAPKGANVVMSEAEPERFFMPPYVAQHGYVGVWLDTKDVDWDEVRELVVEAYRSVAPKTLVKLLPPSTEGG